MSVATDGLIRRERAARRQADPAVGMVVGDPERSVELLGDHHGPTLGHRRGIRLGRPEELRERSCHDTIVRIDDQPPAGEGRLIPGPVVGCSRRVVENAEASLGPDRYEPPIDGVGQQRRVNEVGQVRNVGYRRQGGEQVGGPVGPAAQAGAVTGTP